MKLKAILCVGAAVVSLAVSVSAKGDSSVTEGVTNLSDWNISMYPTKDVSPEQLEVNRWTELVKTKEADYEYEELSIDAVEGHKNLIKVNLKVFLKNGVLLEQKNQQYAVKLDHDRYSHSEVLYVFNTKERTYSIIHTKDISFGAVLLGETDTPIEKAEFKPIEKGSPVETAFTMAKKTYEQMNPVIW
ncbi:MAG: hypothetical protein II175_01930 [Schwartzia sp.]|nr:hypothetical protein [Schwartzia sp. (in: firmicutes)]MBQ1917902.1 hypothetical protein [Schwartzia sp. (in: firmicutes)]